jgi:hypothetical protein
MLDIIVALSFLWLKPPGLEVVSHSASSKDFEMSF